MFVKSVVRRNLFDNFDDSVLHKKKKGFDFCQSTIFMLLFHIDNNNVSEYFKTFIIML